ncbi:MAG: hypothetical protein V4612_04810 [Pseudomonadota bacterium]
MSQTMPKQQPQTPIRFKTFSKYDFVKSFVATATNQTQKEEKEKEAALIADAIEETQSVLLENLATKQDIKNLEKDIKNLDVDLRKDIKNLEIDLRKDIKNLEIDLKKDIKNLDVDLRKDIKILEVNLKKEMQGQLIKLGSLIVILFTILPLLTEFLKKLF